MILWKRAKQIENAVKDYLTEAESCLANFSEAFDVYFEEGLSDAFKVLVEKVDAGESCSDRKRREIEEAMYGNALIPESRGDILGMLESIDLPPNKAESVLHQIWVQNMIVPNEYAQRVKALVKVNVESFAMLCDAARMIFAEISKVMPVVEMVTKKEAESDELERELIKAIFDSPGDTADKILLKELILEIGAISDRAENASDRLRIMAIKRQT